MGGGRKSKINRLSLLLVNVASKPLLPIQPRSPQSQTCVSLRVEPAVSRSPLAWIASLGSGMPWAIASLQEWRRDPLGLVIGFEALAILKGELASSVSDLRPFLSLDRFSGK